MEGGGRFGDTARSTLREATVAKAVHISAITPWEIAMLSDKGRLTLSMAVQAWVERALALPGINLAPIESAIAVDAGTLPGVIHGNPAGRFLVATARTLACPIMTVARAILDYARQGHVKAIDAGRSSHLTRTRPALTCVERPSRN